MITAPQPPSLSPSAHFVVLKFAVDQTLQILPTLKLNLTDVEQVRGTKLAKSFGIATHLLEILFEYFVGTVDHECWQIGQSLVQ